MKKLGAPAWAWKLEDGSLCHWARPYPPPESERPSPDAIRVRVRIVEVARRKHALKPKRGKGE
jgi:hypothetical protein